MALAKKNSRSSGSSESKVKRSDVALHYAICVKNRDYPASLEVRKIYRTVPDLEAERHGLLRVVDESADDYLYRRDFFVPISLPKAAEAAFAGDLII
jgi:hypothetical protein